MTASDAIEDEYVISLDYDPERDDLAGSLEALSKIVQGHQITNSILARAFDEQVSSTIVMEDIQSGSIKLFICNVFKNTQDKEIRDKGLRAFMREAMVLGRQKIVDYINTHEQISDTDDIKFVKGELVDVVESMGEDKRIANVQAMSDRQIADAVGGFAIPTKGLNPSQGLKIIAGGKEYNVNRNFTHRPQEIEKILMASEETWPNQTRLIRIKQLAYEGESQWHVQDDEGNNYKAKIQDNVWLQRFQNGELSPKEFPYPKTVLKVTGTIVIQKDNMGFETDKHFYIENVGDVYEVPSMPYQGRLDDD